MLRLKRNLNSPLSDSDSGEFKFRLVAAFLDAKIAFARVSSFTNEAVLSIKICKNSIGCLKF